MIVKIEKIDNQGRGIAFINNKIAFIKGALPGDEVEVQITVEKKKYILAKVINFISKSNLREKSFCKYSNLCGGCQFAELSYDNSFKLKVDSYKKYLEKNGITNNIIEIKNDNHFNYRNKISLKVHQGKIGFYEENSNKLVEINNCSITNESINNILEELKYLNIKEGFITIRSNYKNEIMLIITTKDKIDISSISALNIIINNEVVKGEKFFFDKINDLIFEISYDSFFQVNPYITSKLFDIINEEISSEDIVVDLYCGVGTLGINASKKAKKVYGFESVKNAVVNANNNALINKCENASFKVADLSKKIVINKDFNTLIIDPPRSGIDKIVMNYILENKPNKLIYVSCDYQTLVRDLALLKEDYNIQKMYVLDMFSFSYHLENLCVLEKKVS